VSPVRYELGFYIPEDGILHSHRREIFKSYTCNVFGSILRLQEATANYDSISCYPETELMQSQMSHKTLALPIALQCILNLSFPEV
jgi:hypothetical protein